MRKDRVLVLSVRLRKLGLLFTVSILAILILFSFGASPVYADTLIVVENQVTFTTMYETTPTLGNDGTSDLVVYTSREMLPGRSTIKVTSGTSGSTPTARPKAPPFRSPRSSRTKS